MANFEETIAKYERELLHLGDTNNRHVDLCLDENNTPRVKDVFTLYDNDAHFALRLFDSVKYHIGDGPASVLKNSALLENEQDLNSPSFMRCLWRGNTTAANRALQKQLNRFVSDAYTDIREKGNNPMFLSLGAIRWKIVRGSAFGGAEEVVITSPLFIFPIKLIRSTEVYPIVVEFTDDDIYVNECFYRLFTDINKGRLEAFPLPEIETMSAEDIADFDMGAYFLRVKDYVDKYQRAGDSNTVFEFLPDLVAISKYTHDDICMYRDIRRNHAKVMESPLIRRLFGGEGGDLPVKSDSAELPRFVLQYDSVQKALTEDVLCAGKCIKVQGPPGTGKTQTIANMIAAAIYSGKRVLFVSRKMPALEEVFYKLPPEISRFVLKIGQDTESSAAKMSKNALQKDFRDTLTFTLDTKNYEEVNAKKRTLLGWFMREQASLYRYYRMMFCDPMKNGYSLYDALVRSMELPNAPCVRFRDVNVSYLVSMDTKTYLEMHEAVDDLGKKLLFATDNYAFLPYRSPHYGINPDKIYMRFDYTEPAFAKVYSVLGDVFGEFPVLRDFSLYNLEHIAHIDFSEEDMAKCLSVENIDLLMTLLYNAKNTLSALDKAGLFADYVALIEEGFFRQYSRRFELKVSEKYDAIEVAALQNIITRFDDHAVNRIRQERTVIKGLVQTYHDARRLFMEKTPVVIDLFGDDVFGNDAKCKVFLSAYKKLEKYAGKGAESFSAMDLGAKSAYKKVLALKTRAAEVKSSRIIEAVFAFNEAYEARCKMVQAVNDLALSIEAVFEEKDMPTLELLLNMESAGEMFEHVICECKRLYETIQGGFKTIQSAFVQNLLQHGNIGDIKRLLEIVRLHDEWTRRRLAVEAECAKVGLSLLPPDGTYPTVSAVHRAWSNVKGMSLIKGIADYTEVIKHLAKVRSEITVVVNDLAKYAKENILSDYHQTAAFGDVGTLRLADIGVFMRYVNDSKMKNAMSDFMLGINEWRDKSLAKFFEAFVFEGKENSIPYTGEYSFADIYRHSFYALFVNAAELVASKSTVNDYILRNAKRENRTETSGHKHYVETDTIIALLNVAIDKGVLGGLRLDAFKLTSDVLQECFDDMATAIEVYKCFLPEYSNGRLHELFANFIEHENAIIANNIDLIGLREVMRIQQLLKQFPHAFDVFTGNKTRYKNPRLMFKKEAEKIMEIKHCFIMSPSTVSTFLGDAAYERFDLAIFDEASQIEPQHLIPVLFRAKQCVVIGDEYQMPPMKYFVRSVGEGKEDEFFDKMESALDLVNAMDSKMDSYSLRCHYRSKSEDLIAYSERYYPDMLTFPSKVSYSRSLGIRDVYVPDGVGAGGVNKREAEVVLDVLRKHMQTNPELSVGVMTFGKEQADYIKRLILQDKELDKLLADLGDGFFVKPIGKLQGREVDHVIMSMTYSKNERGSFNSFGDLDRSNCGENVFNVAASRSRYMMTVIHSYTYAEIAVSNKQSAKYLGEFLRIVEQHAAAGDEEGINVASVVSGKSNAFVESVRDYIVNECGVAPDRVLINYGATQKSLRIPIVILDESRSKCEIGIFCEDAPLVGERSVDYIDYAIRYRESLRAVRGWDKTIRIFVYEWMRYDKERENLKAYIAQNL